MKKTLFLMVAAMMMAANVSGQEDADWVDLGLPSGVLWATRNVGAESPTDYGDYFAWGETEPKSVYDWCTYKWCKDIYDAYDMLTKYCYDTAYGYNGFTDTQTTLLPADDAAASYGGRTPTKNEWEELIDNTTSEWTTMDSVNGRKFISKSNGKSIFLPAAGFWWNSLFFSEGIDVYYWSSSLHSVYTYGAWCCYLRSDDVKVKHSNRYFGQSVRAVRSARR